MRKLAGILLVCCASLALAQNGGVVEGARGWGAARNEAGKSARFTFHAARVTFRIELWSEAVWNCTSSSETPAEA